MNIEEMLLIITSEECSEVAGQISKALRFGIDEQRDLPTSNRERIIDEWNDLMAMAEMLKEHGIIDLRAGLTRKKIMAKKLKVAKYMKYSKELGRLN